MSLRVPACDTLIRPHLCVMEPCCLSRCIHAQDPWACSLGANPAPAAKRVDKAASGHCGCCGYDRPSMWDVYEQVTFPPVNEVGELRSSAFEQGFLSTLTSHCDQTEKICV